MDIIQLLPDSVANQIAAGEVIQRPASVIKELVENAVDANAKRIQVMVVDAGRTSIQVVDDGCGMSITDARLAFERHATSKIRKADDLFTLTTMGFRGEALPSIAAVAQVTLTTRMESDEVGVKMGIAGSKFVSQEPVSAPVGSNFLVENLFFNVPVRRRFLKSNTVELRNVITAFLRIALVYPDIAFTLYSNGQELYNLKATSLHQRVVDVFGNKLNQQLLPVDVQTTICDITGFVGKPESAHKKGVNQYFFVNGRYMKHPYFQKAVMAAFERLIPTGEQVPFFIYFTVKPEDIDVNIHPTKTEIKFQDEQAVWQILAAAVKEAVGKFNNIPSIDFDTEGKPDIPLFDNDSNSKKEMPSMGYNPRYNPFQDDIPSFRPQPTPVSSRINVVESKVPSNWEALYAGLDGLGSSESLNTSPAFAKAPVEQNLFDDVVSDEQTISEKSPEHYQYKGQYIMTAVKSGLMVIHQHRAHTRVLYERYMKTLDEKNQNSQKVLFPEMVQFTAADMPLIPVVIPELERLGFEMSDMGGGAYAVNAVPAGIEGLSVANLIQTMVAEAAECQSRVSADIYASMAQSMARNAAIPVGQVMSNAEMDNLVNDLFACSNSNYTPDGKRILCIIQQREFEHLLS